MKVLLYSWPFYPGIGGLERLTVTATLDEDRSSPRLPFPVERRPRLGRLVRWSDVTSCTLGRLC